MRIIVPLLGALLALGQAAAGEPSLAVAPARYQEVAKQYVADAVIEAVNQSTVSAQVSGRIDEIDFDVDELVPKGAVLLRLRDTEQRARLESAQAGLAEARARQEQARKEFRRVKEVYAKKLVSKAELDRASAELSAASARLHAAQGEARQAQEQLDHTVVKAPYSGIVVKRHVELGETANPGQPLMTGFSLEDLRAVANVPQELIQQVRTHGAATVLLAGDPERRVQTARLTVVPYADPASHTFNVRVYLPAGTPDLYPGMSVKVLFPMGNKKALLVPAKAVVFRSEVTGLYVVDPRGRVSLRQVRVGKVRADGSIPVLAGLDAGERVALDPIAAGRYLKESQETSRHE
jgi:RND family efflux transporter MFP subunit